MSFRLGTSSLIRFDNQGKTWNLWMSFATFCNTSHQFAFPDVFFFKFRTCVNAEIALPGLDKRNYLLCSPFHFIKSIIDLNLAIRCEGSGTSENRARAECTMALVRKLFDANIHTMKRLDIGPGMISFYRKVLSFYIFRCWRMLSEIVGPLGVGVELGAGKHHFAIHQFEILTLIIIKYKK